MVNATMSGGNRRIQHDNHNGAPVIVVLAGNNKVGSYSLAAARHLANRSCHVYVLLASRKEAPLDPVVATQKKCAEYSGARFVDSVDGRLQANGSLLSCN